jgi:phage recombination protein Bet
MRIPAGDIAARDNEYGREKLELLKKTVCKGATDAELELFVHVCKRTGLDPFARQIHAVKRFQDGGQVMTIQTGIDGYRLIADRTGKYAPGREPSFNYDKDGFLQSATSYVKKQTADGTWHEVCATAHFSEYVGLKRDGNPNTMWANKPHIMLSKCSESLALRRAFPAELSGVYTKEEMEQADNGPAPTGSMVDTDADATFHEEWIAAIAGRGGSEEQAGKMLMGLMKQAGKSLGDLDGTARINLIRKATSGAFDKYLAPRKPEPEPEHLPEEPEVDADAQVPEAPEPEPTMTPRDEFIAQVFDLCESNGITDAVKINSALQAWAIKVGKKGKEHLASAENKDLLFAAIRDKRFV